MKNIMTASINNSLYTFFFKFLFYSAIFQLAVWQFHSHEFLSEFLSNFLAQLSREFSLLFTDNILINENKLIHPDTGRYITIDQQCSGLSLSGTLIAAFCSLSIKNSKKLLMSILAVLVIQTLNIIRISHLFFEIQYPVNHFEIYHLYVWQLVNFIFSIGIFYLLCNFFCKEELDVE